MVSLSPKTPSVKVLHTNSTPTFIACMTRINPYCSESNPSVMCRAS